MVREIKRSVLVFLSFTLCVVFFILGNYYVSSLFLVMPVIILVHIKKKRFFVQIIFSLILIEILILGLDLDIIAASPFFSYLSEDCKYSHEDILIRRLSNLRCETLIELEYLDEFQGKIIGIFGGSNTYGAGKKYNDMTYPHYFGEFLENNYKTREFLVLNLGIPGFIIRDKVDVASLMLDNDALDIIVIQHHNLGRRSILCNSLEEIRLHFQVYEDEAYIENFVFPYRKVYGEEYDVWKNNGLNSFLVTFSGTYRFLLGISYRIMYMVDSEYIQDLFMDLSYYGRDFEKLSEFVNDNPNVPIILFKSQSYEDLPLFTSNRIDDIFYFELNYSGKNETYKQLYPPEYVYEWYADELYGFLVENEIIEIHE